MTASIETIHLRKALELAFDEFIAAFSVFDDDAVNRIPFSNSWTPAQVATHIILATDGLPDRKTAPSDRVYDAFLPRIRPWWVDLNQKFQSPVALRPDDKPRMKQEVLAELRRCRENDLAIIAQKDLAVICLDTELPTIGFLTRYEWLWFIEMHLKRHIFQLKNIAARTSSNHV